MTEKEYYVGFDIGTDSIVMALTDTTYRVLKYKGKAMWFVRLFDESMTAAERRAFRSGTRRTARKRERISLLQMLFNSAIAEKDGSSLEPVGKKLQYSRKDLINL